MKYSNLTIKVSVPVPTSSLQGDLQQARYSFENARSTLGSLFEGNFKGRGGAIYYTLGEVDVDTVGSATFQSSAVVSGVIATNPANLATLRLGAQTLTWTSSATAPSENYIVISASTSGSAMNLVDTINNHSVLSNVFTAVRSGVTCSIFYKPVDAVGALLDVSSSTANVAVGSPTGTRTFVVSGSSFKQSVFEEVSLKKGI